MKKIMFGIIIGFVLSFETSTFANTDTLAKLFNVKLKVNGIEKPLTSKSYNIDGSTYVPLREIGNLTGYDVTYKADLQTIELNNGTATQSTIQSAETPTTISQSVPPNPEKEKLNGKIPAKTLFKEYGFKFIVDKGIYQIYKDEENIANISMDELSNNGESSFEYNGNSIEIFLINGSVYISDRILE